MALPTSSIRTSFLDPARDACRRPHCQLAASLAQLTKRYSCGVSSSIQFANFTLLPFLLLALQRTESHLASHRTLTSPTSDHRGAAALLATNNNDDHPSIEIGSARPAILILSIRSYETMRDRIHLTAPHRRRTAPGRRCTLPIWLRCC